MTTPAAATETKALATTNGAPAAEPTTLPQFMRGFDGMSTEPFSDAIRKVLAEPVPPEAVEIKPDGIVYVPGVYYRRQLTRAFGPGGWALAPRQPARVMGDLVIYPGALYCLGRFVAEAVGECTYRQNSNMSYASCVEGAKTDALSRCCKDLGMATELWDAAWRDQWKDNYAERYMGEKWDAKASRKVAKEMWRLRSGRPVQQIDLMSGAGGVAPEASPAPKGEAATSSAQPNGSSPPADQSSSATTAPTPGASEGSSATTSACGTTTPTTIDPGEALGPEAIETIRAVMKRLKWKGSFAKIWLRDFFDVELPSALSKQQGDTALALLQAHGTGAYQALVARFESEGRFVAKAS